METLTAKEVADMLGVTACTVNRRGKRGGAFPAPIQLGSVGRDHPTLYDAAAIRQFIKNEVEANLKKLGA